MKKFDFVISLILFLIIATGIPKVALAEAMNFNIDSGYDISAREDLTATLVKTTSKLSFYIDKNWWDSQNYINQKKTLENLESLSKEFEGRIYPVLTNLFGSERKPGIDGDEKITILFHQMREGAGGYFRLADGYLKSQIPESNEKEMFYLTTAQINNPQLKRFLAHEFIHLITFNQKDKINNVSEEVWLNEARADYALTILGYNNFYEGSNLQQRVKVFLERPTDSLTEWQGKKYDYGSVNLFTEYLVDGYGVEILTDSLKSELVGMLSLNEALEENGFREDFSQIFTDWTIAVLVNDCSLGSRYCYLNKNLKDLHLIPTFNFLPLVGKSSLSVTDVTKNWSGSWQKFIGGKGILKLEFESLTGLNFKVPYLIQDKDGNYSVGFLTLDENQKGEISISDFGAENRSLIIIPSLQTKIFKFDGMEATYPFTFVVSASEETAEEEEELIQKLLVQIDFLKKEIIKITTRINAILGKKTVSCGKFEQDLSLGLRNDERVKCLQEFLKSQGPDVYPEALVTGNFLSLTRAAVIRFQEKYTSEILSPLGLFRGTGFVGLKTRLKINQLLTK